MLTTSTCALCHDGTIGNGKPAAFRYPYGDVIVTSFVPLCRYHAMTWQECGQTVFPAGDRRRGSAREPRAPGARMTKRVVITQSRIDRAPYIEVIADTGGDESFPIEWCEWDELDAIAAFVKWYRAQRPRIERLRAARRRREALALLDGGKR